VESGVCSKSKAQNLNKLGLPRLNFRWTFLTSDQLIIWS